MLSPGRADPRRLKEGEVYVVDGVFPFALAVADEVHASTHIRRAEMYLRADTATLLQVMNETPPPARCEKVDSGLLISSSRC
jgi:hypothetical protein